MGREEDKEGARVSVLGIATPAQGQVHLDRAVLGAAARASETGRLPAGGSGTRRGPAAGEATTH